ncbi:MAG: alpha-glucan family phosphorylase [Myxococcota bacterium]|nr:alpha-glucan family phosphorylase [Myxococcota bacterium]
MSEKLAGADDLRVAADQLAARLPSNMAPFARIAFNYRWCWTTGGDALFAAIDPWRWAACGRNPVRLLQEVPTSALEEVSTNRELIREAYSLEECIAVESSAPRTVDGFDPDHPVAFLCAEFGVHGSLPIYSGGLGVLAGDLLKAASDAAFPLVGIGLLYWQGYFRQRMDISGWQNEYWVESDAPRLPGARITHDGAPLEIHVPIRGRDVTAHVWRFSIGRTPLFLLDTNVLSNAPIDRWITSRLYAGDRDTRLAQYALLGIGGIRALRAMEIDPALIHLNEGHAALASLELASEQVAEGFTFEEALGRARASTIFTTHTPVPAGNERYSAEEMHRVFSGLDERLATTWSELEGLARVHPGDAEELPGMTCLALRMSEVRNGVSQRHGAVARGIWRPLFGSKSDETVPIGHVTNGVHVSTWMAEPVRSLLTRYLGHDWEQRSLQPELWELLDDVPDEELWAVRCELRRRLVDYVREHATMDRLARGEAPDYVEQAQHAFDPDRLTLGFARRLATYKRLHLFSINLPRALDLLEGPESIQILLAGKAHPSDDEAKRVVQGLFTVRSDSRVGERIAYLHDYDMHMARFLVSGCDVWVNTPRPPLEASGTSGMKAALNGALNLSVLDGWWIEAHDGTNGWGIQGDENLDPHDQDERDARALLDLLEKEVIPLFHDRDENGVPRAWIQRVRSSIRVAAQGFSARRMLADYVDRAYSSG